MVVLIYDIKININDVKFVWAVNLGRVTVFPLVF